MKIRRSISILSMLVIGLSITACTGGSDLDQYLKAEEKTATMTSGHMNMQAQVVNKWGELDTHYEYDFDRDFNHETGQSISHIYILENDLGTDMTLYEMSPSERYLKLPMFPGYMDLSDKENTMEGQDSQQVNELDTKVIRDIFKEIDHLFKEGLNDENIFKGEKVLIDTPDGKVKATQYTIMPSKALLDVMVQQITELDSDQREGISKSFNLDAETIDSIWQALDQGTQVEVYNESVYVNMDGYVIQKSIHVILHFQSDNLPRTMRLNIELNHSQINQEPQLQFPEINSDDLYIQSDLKEAY